MNRFICLAVSVILIINSAACSGAQGEMTWQEQYDLGLRYLSEGKYEEAIIAFTAAIEIDPKQAPAYVGRGDAYKGVAQLSMASAGADAELTEDAANAYNNAIGDYLRALELDESIAGVYKKAAEVYVVLGDTEAAVEIIERGITAAGDKSLSEYLEQLNNEIAQKLLQSLLSDIPYYGDISKCKMTAEQAAAYAQVIADGIAGKYSAYGWDGTLKPFFWEQGNEAGTYPMYKTNRANVILADLDGSGVPYLYVFSSLVENCSYDVYGWSNGEAKFATGAECFQSFAESALYESDNGTVIEVSSSYSGGSRSETYIFSNGVAKRAFSWGVAYIYPSDIFTALLQVTINGKTTDYPDPADFDDAGETVNSANPYKTVDPATRNLPYAPFSEVESKPIGLRQMMTALNNYASALNVSSSRPATTQENSSTQLMAQTMLDKLAVLGEPEAYLLDMNADGIPELLCHDHSLNIPGFTAIRSGGYHVFRWDGRKLFEHQFEGNIGVPSIYGYEIIKYDNEYALVSSRFHALTESAAVYFLDHIDILCSEIDIFSEDGDLGYYYFNGEEITEQRYMQLFDEYCLDSVDSNIHTVRTDLPDARTELNKLLVG